MRRQENQHPEMGELIHAGGWVEWDKTAQLPIAMLSSCKFVGGNLFLNIEPLPYSSSGAVPPTLALQPPSSKDLGWDYNGST